MPRNDVRTDEAVFKSLAASLAQAAHDIAVLGATNEGPVYTDLANVMVEYIDDDACKTVHGLARTSKVEG